ncbi:MAG: hypothetical protein FJY86_02825 [Candidatus Diapherotrites archaeon]|uniref:Uncharacterized protein n=1 Tax=Candidatus Iainarchaeum sp. TaxID=3101447 RepID=A0A8T4C7H2_9ARCH|nr:hypothetical protein [Candidatus Diapherotrites archaeon]
MATRKPGNHRIGFHLVELGAGSAEASIRHKRRNPRHRVAVVDRVYNDSNLVRSPIPILEKYSLHVFPDTYRGFFKKMIAEGVRTPKIILDMPWQRYPCRMSPVDSALRQKRFEAQLRGVLRDLPQVLVPGGHLAITSERVDWMKMLHMFAKERGLVTSPIREISHARALVQSETTRDVRKYTGKRIYRLVISLPR